MEKSENNNLENISINNASAVLIVINFNGINYIKECLESLIAQEYDNFKILVVDNNSKDGSVKYIRDNYPEIDILVNFFNKGYGDAINRAVKYASKKYGKIDFFGILNNDLRLNKNWLGSLISYAEKKPSSGILAGKMMIYNWPKYINSTGGCVNYFGSGWDRDFFELDSQCAAESGEVLSVSGGAMLIKREVFETAGYFDSKYFMYYEDIDFCFKTWKYTDYTIDYVKEALVYHKFSASSGVMSLKKHFYLKRARFIFILKNYPLAFLLKIIPQIRRYEFGFIMKDLLVRYDFVNFFREFYIYLIFLCKLPVIIGSRLLKKDNRAFLRADKAKKMWSMVSTTKENSGRRFIPMQYLDMLWNKYETYGEESNRIIMGINDKALGSGFKSLITKGYPRGRFFFNYAELALKSPYRGSCENYFFQMQYFLYDRKSDELFIDIDGYLFNTVLNERMNTIVFKVPCEAIKDKENVKISLSFNEDILKKASHHQRANNHGIKNNNKSQNISSDIDIEKYLTGNTEEMDNKTFEAYLNDFKDLFVIEISILSEDSQYLRKEISDLNLSLDKTLSKIVL